MATFPEQQRRHADGCLPKTGCTTVVQQFPAFRLALERRSPQDSIFAFCRRSPSSNPLNGIKRTTAAPNIRKRIKAVMTAGFMLPPPRYCRRSGPCTACHPVFHIRVLRHVEAQRSPVTFPSSLASGGGLKSPRPPQRVPGWMNRHAWDERCNGKCVPQTAQVSAGCNSGLQGVGYSAGMCRARAPCSISPELAAPFRHAETADDLRSPGQRRHPAARPRLPFFDPQRTIIGEPHHVPGSSSRIHDTFL